MDSKSDQSLEQTILQVAERLFLEKGFAQTSTTEIAKIAGCNQALVHYYYRTKDNLFNVIFEQKFKLLFKGIFEMKSLENMKFQDKLKYIIETHFDLLRKNPGMPSLILNELSRRPEQITALREKLHELPEKLIVELNKELQLEIEKGNIREISLIDLIVTMLSLNISLFIMLPVVEKALQWDEAQKEFMISHRRSENVDFILKSLRP